MTVKFYFKHRVCKIFAKLRNKIELCKYFCDLRGEFVKILQIWQLKLQNDGVLE